jgi:hypothetical protein
LLFAAILALGTNVGRLSIHELKIVSGALQRVGVWCWRKIFDPELTPAAGHNLAHERVGDLRRWKGIVLIYPALRLNEVPHPV